MPIFCSFQPLWCLWQSVICINISKYRIIEFEWFVIELISWSTNRIRWHQNTEHCFDSNKKILQTTFFVCHCSTDYSLTFKFMLEICLVIYIDKYGHKIIEGEIYIFLCIYVYIYYFEIKKNEKMKYLLRRFSVNFEAWSMFFTLFFHNFALSIFRFFCLFHLWIAFEVLKLKCCNLCMMNGRSILWKNSMGNLFANIYLCWLHIFCLLINKMFNIKKICELLFCLQHSHLVCSSCIFILSLKHFDQQQQIHRTTISTNFHSKQWIE